MASPRGGCFEAKGRERSSGRQWRGRSGRRGNIGLGFWNRARRWVSHPARAYLEAGGKETSRRGEARRGGMEWSASGRRRETGSVARLVDWAGDLNGDLLGS